MGKDEKIFRADEPEQVVGQIAVEEPKKKVVSQLRRTLLILLIGFMPLTFLPCSPLVKAIKRKRMHDQWHHLIERAEHEGRYDIAKTLQGWDSELDRIDK